MIKKLILGTVQFGLNYGINNFNGLVSEDETYKILNFSAKNKIRFLDTAADYGDSEKRIGQFSKINYSAFSIISKFSKINKSWKASITQTLENLNVEKIDCIMFHSYESYLINKGIIHEILNVKGSLFNKLGVSVYTNEELAALKGDINVDVIQCPFNLLDNHSIRSQYLINLKEEKKTIHTRSVFLQGLFFMDIKNIPIKLKSLIPLLKNIHTIANDNQISIGHLALQYALSKNYIDGVLIGVDSVDQLKKNIFWANSLLDSNLFQEIDKILIDNTTLLNPSKW